MPTNRPRDWGLTAEVKMAAVARALDRMLELPLGFESLKPIAVFCGAGLAISLVLASYGIDLSPEFF
jgi:hypothetical protein